MRFEPRNDGSSGAARAGCPPLFVNPPVLVEFLFRRIRSFALVLGGLCAGMSASAEAPPNVLIFLADDMTYSDCGPYGSDQVATPHLDRFAQESLTFDAMYTSTAMCVPTRAQLWSGLYPVRGGCYPNHSQLHDDVVPLPTHLKALGYRIGAMGKKGSNPPGLYDFDWTGGALNPITLAEAEAFIRDADERPFLLWVGSNQPHTPWNKGPRERYDADELTVPDYLVDTPETREAMVKYYAEISEVDREFGDFLQVLDESGQAENTIVIFTSEQGSSLPFGGKWSCYENGLKTAWIVRWPGRVAPGTRTAAQTQYVDFAPTMVEIAGGDPVAASAGRADAEGSTGFDGRSFLSVLLGEAQTHRKYVFGAHTTIGVAGATASGYGIRSVSDGEFKLIVNLQPEHTFSCANTQPDDQPLKSWREAGEQGDAWARQRAHAYVKRPALELYDLARDPQELRNLAEDPAHAGRIDELRLVLGEWMRQQGDLGVETELAGRFRLQRYLRPKS